MKIYKIVLSAGDPIPIYQEEIPAVVEAIRRGDKIIATKRGIFNPSFYVVIQTDKKWSEAAEEDEKYGRKTLLPGDMDLAGLTKLAEMKQKTLKAGS